MDHLPFIPMWTRLRKVKKTIMDVWLQQAKQWLHIHDSPDEEKHRTSKRRTPQEEPKRRLRGRPVATATTKTYNPTQSLKPLSADKGHSSNDAFGAENQQKTSTRQNRRAGNSQATRFVDQSPTRRKTSSLPINHTYH